MNNKTPESSQSKFESQDIMQSFSDEKDEPEDYIIRRKGPSKSLRVHQAPSILNLPKHGIMKCKSTRFEDEDKETRMEGKFKTFLDLRNEKKLTVETQSMLQITDNGLSQMMLQSQNSFNSLSSLEGLYYRNPLETDYFEDEELSLEYRTLEYIGQGYHALVKKVQHIVTNEIFAAKITRINDEEIGMAIQTECDILKRLDHPFIIKAYRVIRNPSKSLITIITEYVDSKNLLFMITKNGKNIPVEYLHSNFICHRDISPKNILVSEDISIFKLIDFGVSKIFMSDNNPIEMITPTGLPAYRPPEVWKGNKMDEKIDIWNCGHVFFEILMGKHITSKKLYKLIKEKDLANQLKEYSKETVTLIDSLLELNPKKRVKARECLQAKVFEGL